MGASEEHAPVDLFTFVDLYDRVLDTLSHLLGKGEAFAAERGIAADEWLGWRLADDMHPLRFQAMVVVTFTRLWTARVAGLPDPVAADQALDMAGFRAAIADAKAHLAALTRDQFAGRDALPLSFQITDTLRPTIPAAQWLSVFATTNVYFHLSMVYAILRTNGAPLGKIDFFAGRL